MLGHHQGGRLVVPGNDGERVAHGGVRGLGQAGTVGSIR